MSDASLTLPWLVSKIADQKALMFSHWLISKYQLKKSHENGLNNSVKFCLTERVSNRAPDSPESQKSVLSED